MTSFDRKVTYATIGVFALLWIPGVTYCFWVETRADFIPAFKGVVPYRYDATVSRVVDGDTVDVMVDLGLDVLTRKRIRLDGIDAPETRGDEKEAGRLASEYLLGLIPVGSEIVIHTDEDKRGKYGRYLGVVWLDDDGEWVNVNSDMVDSGHAIEREY